MSNRIWLARLVMKLLMFCSRLVRMVWIFSSTAESLWLVEAGNTLTTILLTNRCTDCDSSCVAAEEMAAANASTGTRASRELNASAAARM